MPDHAAFRSLPSVDRVLALAEVRELEATLSRELLANLVREAIARARDEVAAGHQAPTAAAIAAAARAAADALLRPGPHWVINASGVIIHTNLGRAPLSPAAAEAMRRAAT
ncbi:MAG: L-seryl-tRNA(Sec) selenium transferase, partial [Chloroflexi bacterium]|nr:L-seryl-tRNA(Sec) selenium transferase [Chloroflexota bacterium]